MRGQVITRLLYLFTFLFLSKVIILADPVNLTGAGLTAGGTNGLTLTGPGVEIKLPFGQPTFPGVNYSGLTTIAVPINTTLGAGQLVIGGTDFGGYLLSGNATFTIDLTSPTVTPEKFWVSDTRTFTGTLAVIDPKTGATVAVLDFEFTAKVTVSLTGDPCGCYYISGILTEGGRGTIRIKRFDHQPVPEPATLLLLGSGLAAIGMRVRKKKPQLG
jgi:hypothetical protein